MTYLEKEFVVGGADSAKTLGSGDLDVLGTPAIVAFVENTCKELMSPTLEDNQTTVGIEIQLNHLKGSGLVGSIIVKAELIEQTKKIVSFQFEVYQGESCLARGKHKRVNVEIERFLRGIDK